MSGFMSASGVAAAKTGDDCTIYISKASCESKEGEACYPLNYDDPRKVTLVSDAWELDAGLEAAVNSADAAYESQQTADAAALAILITKLKQSKADINTEISALNAAGSLASAKTPIANSLVIIRDSIEALVKHLKI